MNHPFFTLFLSLQQQQKNETDKETLAQVLVSEKLILWEDFPRVRLQCDLYSHQIFTWRRGIVRVNTKKVLNGYKTSS